MAADYQLNLAFCLEICPLESAEELKTFTPVDI